MPVLAMTTPDTDKPPAIPFHQLNSITYFRQTQPLQALLNLAMKTSRFDSPFTPS